VRELNLPRTLGTGFAPAPRGARPAGKTATTGSLRRQVHERVYPTRGCAMPREPIPFAVSDLSAFARALTRALAARGSSAPPTHVEMLNLLARAAGRPNFQALRAQPRPHAEAPVPAAAPALSDAARRALRLFGPDGRMSRWPARFSVQRLAMWILWTRFEQRRVYSEKDVNAVLRAAHTFGDHATLRRELVNHRLLERTSDCAEYRRLPARPDAEARALLAAWRARRREPAAAGQAAPAGG
jgi:hypothetical protein